MSDLLTWYAGADALCVLIACSTAGSHHADDRAICGMCLTAAKWLSFWPLILPLCLGRRLWASRRIGLKI